ncbi:hypothetical protein [Adhaeribacter pallidiroseus]|uniref:Uncharacterized protein n=1 Tax=Adhaeribacter pallidiroseus TaxID=2072847 RepID=A0A369QIV7_9BACT|nr:hypothetical protein [Adhaeribacter pallidiroseus]RDC63166.1 hypothetical protein AHMF7616_01767 [Adhaeribacter pallidiroseus]
MKEEEVDQYFKNKFNQFTPAPSADAWARLQSKMEPPQKKKSVMWVYYAAAVFTVTLLSGALYFYLNTNSLNPNIQLTQLKPLTVPLQVEPKLETSLADVGPKTPSALSTMEPQSTEKNIKNSTSNTAPVNKPVKKVKKIRPGILVAAAKSLPYTNHPDKAATPENYNTDIATTNAPNTTSSNSAPAASEYVMEVIIKKDPEVLAAAPDNGYQTVEEAIKENVSKKGRLVKNIFKQARNLKNGEKVELSTLGLNANYRIDVESKLFKQKYTKVINL